MKFMMKSYDVLFLCQFFYPEYVSSATLPFDTAMALSLEGYSVGVLCGYPKEYTLNRSVPQKEVYKNIHINRIKYLQLVRKTFFGRIINYLSFIGAMLFHLSEIGKYKVIIVYSNPPILPVIAVLAKKIYGSKIIFVSYDVYPEIGINTGKIKQGGIIDKGFRIINKIVYNNVYKVVALSEDMKQFLTKKRELTEKKVFIIPNWAEDKNIHREIKSENSLFKEIPRDAFVVSYLGNLGICQEEKTFFNAICALKENVNIHFLIAGHGTKMAELKRLVKNEKLKQVHFYDFLQGENYEDALRCSDLCVVTLVKGMKGLCSPSKASGYLMAGCPVIVVAERGVELAEDVIKNQCGYQVTPGDTMTMKKCILEQYGDKELNNLMGKNSLELFRKKYEKKTCLKEYIQLVKKGI